MMASILPLLLLASSSQLLQVESQAADFPLTRVRSLDGSDGNPGCRVGSALRRTSGYDYPFDGSGKRIKNYPNPRLVSNRLLKQRNEIPNARNLTDFVWAWGQFIDHDMVLTPSGEEAGEAPIPVTMEIDRMGKNTFIPFTRSMYMSGSGTPQRPREHFNVLTSVLDGGVVYGNDPARSGYLREYKDGRLRTYNNETRRSRVLPPLNLVGFFNDGNEAFDPAELFVCGEARANEQLTLLTLHTMFLREHNRLCSLIKKKYPGADDEQIFQLARKMVGMEIQKITYEEWLPAVLGPLAPSLKDYQGHDPTIDVGMRAEFAGAAFRFGHTMVSDRVELVKKNGEINHKRLRNAFFNHEFVKERPFRVDQTIQGLTLHSAQEIDPFIIEDVRSFLFGKPGEGGLDLASINIQRSRDLGLPRYNAVRKAYNLTAKPNFEDVTSDVDLQNALRREYRTTDRIDLFVGVLAEEHVPGASVGELLGTILQDQFDRLMHGDSFFYLNDPDLSKAKMQGIISHKKMKLANIIRFNTYFKPDSEANVFFMPSASL